MFTGRYAFLLGVIPATLATLLLLGHTPLQLLLIGAYIVTVYVLNFDGGAESTIDSKKEGDSQANLWLSLLLESLTKSDSEDGKDALQRDESSSSSLEQSIPFLELLKWLDKSALAPMLNEKTIELLYRVTNLAEALQK